MEGSKGFFGLKGKSTPTVLAWVKSARLDDYFSNILIWQESIPLIKKGCKEREKEKSILF